MTNYSSIAQGLKDFFFNAKEFVGGLFSASISFFFPIKNHVQFIIVLFLIEMILGYKVKKKHNKSLKFSLTIVYEKTMLRLLLTLIVMTLAFILDVVTDQKYIPTYNLLGYWFMGLLILKISKYSFILTGWEGFKFSTMVISKRLKNKKDELDSE